MPGVPGLLSGWLCSRGDLRGKRVEVHASRDYVRAIEGALAAKGAIVFDPLAGLAHGQRLAWYGARTAM